MMSNFSKHNYFLAVFVIIGTGLLAAHPATANASSPVKLVGPLPSKL